MVFLPWLCWYARLVTFTAQPFSIFLVPKQTCPLLLRVFCKEGGHHRAEEYAGTQVPPEELRIYTWYDCCGVFLGALSLTGFVFWFRMDATLKELAQLIKEVNVAARWASARLVFAAVYRDKCVVWCDYLDLI